MQPPPEPFGPDGGKVRYLRGFLTVVFYVLKYGLILAFYAYFWFLLEPIHWP